MDINKHNYTIPYGTSPDGFVPSMAVVQFLENKNRILVVGDFMKRDYAVLHALGKEVHVMDIVRLEGIERFIFNQSQSRRHFKKNILMVLFLQKLLNTCLKIM